MNAVAEVARNNGEKTGRLLPPVEYRFKPGNPGRPKGSRNKLGEAFVEALQQDFETHGVDAIEKVRTEKPDQYLKVIAQVIPKEIIHKVEDYDEYDDDTLAAEFLRVAGALQARAEDRRGDRAQKVIEGSASQLSD